MLWSESFAPAIRDGSNAPSNLQTLTSYPQVLAAVDAMKQAALGGAAGAGGRTAEEEAQMIEEVRIIPLLTLL